tara:strand:+ start:1940 stop:3481 length:1542 start_codon:yes stop_codon:yes gene_type:complete
MALPNLDSLANREALDKLATLIDLAEQLELEEGTERALEWCERLEQRDFTPLEEPEFHYFWANAWGDMQHHRHNDPKVAWAWDQPEQSNQILHLRRALNSTAFDQLPAMRRCQILTNLANQLNTAGRFVEALEYWTRALDLVPDFWMAQGNRGIALLTYGGALYDDGHRDVFLIFAHDDLVTALASEPILDAGGPPSAVAGFQAKLNQVNAYRNVDRLREEFELNNHSLGETAAEQSYRRWCLNNHLFLNPLNDVGPIPLAARDVFALPGFVVPISKPPILIGFFNQMKQEFVSARWLYYEALNASEMHFSDKDVSLFNTLDYPSYSLSVEKLKLAYRSAYSIFDKIAFFLNEYMDLGMKPDEISFAKVWRAKWGEPVRGVFEDSENLPLRGLFWLSKDFFYRHLQEVTEPDARALRDIRNHLEHKYFKVHEMLLQPAGAESERGDLFTDTLAYSVERTDFEKKTLRLIKLARAALIYLSLGMHREERRRAASRPEGLIMQMELHTWDDERKR